MQQPISIVEEINDEIVEETNKLDMVQPQALPSYRVPDLNIHSSKKDSGSGNYNDNQWTHFLHFLLNFCFLI